jgi:phospholipid-binding lipoprotein MlaA
MAALLLAGCAAQRAADGPQDANDPLENWNRAVFTSSIALDKLVFRPVAIVYRDAVPLQARDLVRNFLNNLNSPVILTNDLLQGEGDRAKITLVRAGVNTTIGVGGLFDIAQRWGFDRHSEDFGQTLAVWGVGEGPYLFFPIIGPGNPRDLIGRGIDFLFDPLTYVQWGDAYYVPAARFGVDYLDLRARNVDTLDELEKTSLDYYASVRSLYRQTRDNEIRNGATEVQDLPDF